MEEANELAALRAQVESLTTALEAEKKRVIPVVLYWVEEEQEHIFVPAAEKDRVKVVRLDVGFGASDELYCYQEDTYALEDMESEGFEFSKREIKKLKAELKNIGYS